MINYLQSVTVFGVPTGLQRSAVRRQKTLAIQTDDGKALDVESVRSLSGVEGTSSMNEDRLEERKHGMRMPRNEEEYLLALHEKIVLLRPVVYTRERRWPPLPGHIPGLMDLVA